jgi:hypothetical protein
MQSSAIPTSRAHPRSPRTCKVHGPVRTEQPPRAAGEEQPTAPRYRVALSLLSRVILTRYIHGRARSRQVRPPTPDHPQTRSPHPIDPTLRLRYTAGKRHRSRAIREGSFAGWPTSRKALPAQQPPDRQNPPLPTPCPGSADNSHINTSIPRHSRTLPPPVVEISRSAFRRVSRKGR